MRSSNSMRSHSLSTRATTCLANMSVPKFGCRFLIRNISSQTRSNPLGVQMLSKSLYQQVFPGVLSQPDHSQEAINKSISHLSEHGLWTNKSGTTVTQEDIDIKLPPLFGKDISSHFTKLAEDQLSPYYPLIASLVFGGTPPSPPTQWNYEPGWTRYSNDGSYTLISFPDEKALVFDVEVCVPEGHAPKLAVAMSPDYLYSWVSPRLFSKRDFAEKSRVNFDELIPLEGGEESWSERIIVGHNVSYDRARIKEQYLINGPKMKFLDTLSLHVCVSGQTSAQKVLWRSVLKREQKEMDSKVSVHSSDEEEFSDAIAKLSRLSKEKWMEVSSPNSLADVYRLHCGGEEIDKSLGEIFIKGNSSDIRNNFQDLMCYCYQDVKCTYEILKVLYPLFLHHCPHPVTLAGMLEMSTMYLPVNESWDAFMQSANYTAEDMELEMTKKLMFIADQACWYMKNEKYQEDIWLSNLDWSSKKYRSKRKTKKEMTALMEKVRSSSINQVIATRNKMEEEDEGEGETLLINDPNAVRRATHKPGYPEWYRQLCVNINHSPWQSGPCKITPSMRVTPYLLRIKWAGYPVYYHTVHGWGYIIPKEREEGKNDSSNGLISSDFEAVSDDGLAINDFFPISEEDERPPKMKTDSNKRSTEAWLDSDDIITLNGKQYYYYRIPHKNGSMYRVGNPLSKDYLSKMQSGILTSALGDGGQRILELNSMTSFWRSNEKRLCNQFVVWTNEESEFNHKRKAQGVILPMVQVAGTVTRRAVEGTWLTASNAKINRIGSEIKAFVQAPPGYCIVGADVDSQEVWIASLLGDNHFTGIQGGTAFGWMSLQGNKSEGTDIHSKTAQTIGITRDHAKVFNYSRIYGSGKQFSNMLLKQFNPLLSDEEVDAKSNSLYESTKGIKRLLLSKKTQEIASSAGITVHSDGSINQSDWITTFKKYPPKARGDPYWYGGTESHMFNKLESIARSPQPRTPVLNCLISTALQRENVKGKYMTSRVNWVVQSSAVDYLHLLLVAVKWLMAHYNITGGRLCISIHDEVRYVVREEDKYKMSLALQVANIWTRAMFAHQLGMNDLPLSVAFFSAVDIDTVLRKEVNMDCETPSNPLGLNKGYGIGFGEAVNMKQTIEKLRETKQLDI